MRNVGEEGHNINGSALFSVKRATELRDQLPWEVPPSDG